MKKQVPPKTVSLVKEVAKVIVEREFRHGSLAHLTIAQAVDYLVRQCLVLLVPHSYWARAEAVVPHDKLHDVVVDEVRARFTENLAKQIPDALPEVIG